MSETILSGCDAALTSLSFLVLPFSRPLCPKCEMWTKIKPCIQQTSNPRPL